MINELPKCKQELEEFNVRNSAELDTRWLQQTAFHFGGTGFDGRTLAIIVFASCNQVQCLDGHDDVLESCYLRVQQALDVPLSEVNCEKVDELIHTEKECLKDCEADIKDAKRRISTSKPKSSKKRKLPELDEDSDSEKSG